MGDYTEGWFKMGDAFTFLTGCVMVGVPVFCIGVGVCIGALLWA